MFCVCCSTKLSFPQDQVVRKVQEVSEQARPRQKSRTKTKKTLRRPICKFQTLWIVFIALLFEFGESSVVASLLFSVLSVLYIRLLLFDEVHVLMMIRVASGAVCALRPGGLSRLFVASCRALPDFCWVAKGRLYQVY